jgi:iron complex outermembrane receptor protein
MKPIVLCLFASIIVNHSFAQEKTSDLDPVTVTASVNPEKASRTGRDLIIIKGERFTNLPIHSVDELLRYLPGVEVQARGPMGSQSDIVIRGGTFQQVLVIIDGMRLNDPTSGHFTSYFPIAPAEIDHIEILKGASSAIYGSDAVTGVINIVTKTFASKNKPRQEAGAQLTVGEYGLITANAGGFYSDGRTSIGAGILSNNSSGQLQRGTRGSFYLNTVSLSFSHRLTENWLIDFRSAIDNRKFGAQNFYTFSPKDTADERVQTSWNQLRVVYQKQKNRFSLNTGYKGTDDEYAFYPSGAANLNRSKLIQSLAVYEHQFNENTSLVSGAQYQNRSVRSNDRGNHSVNQVAAFAILNQQIGSAFHVSPAVRVDWHELGGTEFIPQLNLSYKVQHLQLRACGGKTIRYADFTEQYNNYNKPPYVAAGQRMGDPDLKAETSWNYEGGADLFLSHVKLSATYFHRDYNDMIDYVNTPYSEMPRKVNLSPGASYLLAKNIVDVNTKGFETYLQWDQSLGNNQELFATLGASWVNSENNQATPSLYLTSYAKFLANGNIIYTANRFSISVSGLYKQRTPQQKNADASNIAADVSHDYFIVNAKLEAFIIKKVLSAFAEGDNLFDKSYSDLLGAQMPGRWLMGGIKISLSK